MERRWVWLCETTADQLLICGSLGSEITMRAMLSDYCYCSKSTLAVTNMSSNNSPAYSEVVEHDWRVGRWVLN